jgi:bifunctional non-homologous end joining protein LigD
MNNIPEFVPMLAQPEEKPFDRDGWAFDLKLDGKRIIAYRYADGRVRLMSRPSRGNSGVDNAPQFPWLVEAMRELPAQDIVLDGEVVALDEKGRPSFALLQNYRTNRAPLVYYTFDLLWSNGERTTHMPLRYRRQLLDVIVPPGTAGRIQRVMSTDGVGTVMFEFARAQGLEGVVAKSLSAPYTAGRSPSWLKVKVWLADEFVIGGWTYGEGARAHTIGSLVLGYYPSGSKRLRYVGAAGTGLDTAELNRLLPKLQALRGPSAYEGPIPEPGTQFVRPELVAQIKYHQKTDDGRLRFPVYQGLRDDKSPEDARPDWAA